MPRLILEISMPSSAVPAKPYVTCCFGAMGQWLDVMIQPCRPWAKIGGIQAR